MKKFFTGNEAAAEGVRLSKVETIAAFPITPQTAIVDRLAELIVTKKMKATLVPVESEFSAISVAAGSELGGVRAFTATSSQGLMMMTEATYFVSGMRIPLVMVVVNRGLSAPVTIFSDHQDSMTLRDNGWLQYYCKDAQEALDTILLAYYVSEHEKILLPSFVCLDGFFISHLSELVEVPTEEQTDQFIPSFDPRFPHFDTDDPKFLGTAAWPDYYEEFVYKRTEALNSSIKIIDNASKKFYDIFGRPLVNLLETYHIDDAETILIGLGSMMSTLELSIDELRRQGQKVGLIRLKVFRPFPGKKLLEKIKNSPITKIVVLDRSISSGSFGPLFLDVASFIHSSGLDIDVFDVILGLGGRDITIETGLKLINKINREKIDRSNPNPLWIDLNRETISRWSDKSHE